MSTTTPTHMANISFVTDRLATGGDLHEDEEIAVDQLVDLIEQGISHIVDCRMEFTDEDFVVDIADWIEYLHLGVDDHGRGMPDAWYDQGTAWVAEALEDPDAIVLVHCHMGVNRGPSLTYAVLLTQGVDPVEAIDAIRRARPIAGVLYAEDALDWWHRRQDAPAEQRADDIRRLAEWRRDSHLDVARVIRRIRAEQHRGRR
jgi:hypothetical protein